MVVWMSTLRTSHFLPPQNNPGTHFCQRLSRPQGHSAIGRIMSMTPSGIEPAPPDLQRNTLTTVLSRSLVNWLPTRIFRCLIWKKQDKFLCSKMFKIYLQPIHTRIQFVWENISSAIQRPVHEINHPLRCSGDIKEEWNCTSTTPVCLHCM